MIDLGIPSIGGEVDAAYTADVCANTRDRGTA